MSFVINLTDATGREFFFNEANDCIPLDSPRPDSPVILKNHNQVVKNLDSLRKRFSCSCKLYAVERREFEQRRKDQSSPPKK